jgi:hypothetical protein
VHFDGFNGGSGNSPHAGGDIGAELIPVARPAQIDAVQDALAREGVRLAEFVIFTQSMPSSLTRAGLTFVFGPK